MKRGADAPLFDRLFDLYFSGLARVVEALERSVLRDLEESGVLEGDELDAWRRSRWRASRRDLSPLARAALTGDAALLARLLRGAALDHRLLRRWRPATQLGFYGRRLLSGAGGAGAGRRSSTAFRRALPGARPRPGAACELVVGAGRGAALATVEDAARRYADLEREARGRARPPRGRLRRQRGFATLTREEIARTETAVRRLAERLHDRLAPTGALPAARHAERPAHAAAQPGLGRPAGAALLPPPAPRARPDVVVLCDVSDSVRHVSRLMLLFVHTLQSLFSRVRSFVFVSDLGEVTDAFRAGARRGPGGRPGHRGQGGEPGRELQLRPGARHLPPRYLGAVTRRTTVIVIGDGRSNYNAARGLGARRRSGAARAGSLWICPEERWAWGSGDSEMPLYAAQVDRVATVTRLSDLEEIAEALVPGVGVPG